jgi:Ser/Thr protein kinase RdoA (MazF antagonist)
MIPSKRSLLDEHGLKDYILQTYALPKALTVTFWRTGIAGNDVYLLKTPQQQYVLKVYFVRSLSVQIQASVQMMDVLAQQQIPVPRLLRNLDGECVTSLPCPEGIRYAVICEYLQGQEPDIFNDDDALTIGRLVGRLYRSLDTIDSTMVSHRIDRNYLIQSALDALPRYCPDEREKIRYFTTMGHRLWTMIERYAPRQEPSYGLCHGDLHTGNMLKVSSGDIVLFDFDACGYGARVYDLGVYANDNWAKTSPQELQRDREALDKFLCGYTEYGSLTADEYALFPALLGIRHFELLGLVLRNCVFLEGTSWVKGCLRFHYEWFLEWERHVEWKM